MNQSHLARIHLLSRRFYELQGLRLALLGSAIVIVLGGYRLIARSPTEPGFFLALGVSAALALLGMPWLSRYYANTFGRQQKPKKPHAVLKTVVLLTTLLLLNVILEPLDPPPGTPTAVVVGLASLWLALRDWPWRAHWLLVAVAVAIPLAATLARTGGTHRDESVVTTYLLLGLSFVLVGILEHRLLVRLMEEARAPESERARNSAH